MKDEEIIKALGLCFNINHNAGLNCCECPYKRNKCSLDLYNDTIDLINRQQAEIERLKASPKINESTLTKKLKAVANGEKVDCYDGTEQGDVIAAMCYDAYYVILGLKARIKEIKAETIKEFAKRLKATFPPREDERCTLDDCYTLDCIDRIAEEMVGADNGKT